MSFMDLFGLVVAIFEEIHEKLQVLSAILVTAAIAIGAAMVFQPELLVEGIYAEYCSKSNRYRCLGSGIIDKKNIFLC